MIYASLTLTRNGNTITASVCKSECQVIGTTQFPSGPALIGVAVTSHDPAAVNNAYFPANMPTVTRNALPQPWRFTDVGDVGLAGRASQSNGTFAVAGAGSDIWGTADSFAAVTQSIAGEAHISARVVGEQNTNPFAKAGVMVGDLSPSSARVILDAKPDGWIEFMARLADGMPMSYLSGAAASFPVYLRLTRTRAGVEGAFSADGSNWTTVGSVQIQLPSTVNAGLAVTSHDPTVRNTATFDHVDVAAIVDTASNLIVNGGFEPSTVPASGPGGCPIHTGRRPRFQRRRIRTAEPTTASVRQRRIATAACTRISLCHPPARTP
jgi:hypothetical protein